MKNILVITVISLCIAACKTTPAYHINGEIRGLDEGKVILLQLVDGQRKAIDSTDIMNGSFAFTGSIITPEIFFLQVNEPKNTLSFFLENSEIFISASIDSIRDAKITGSSVQDEFTTYNQKVGEFNKQLQEIWNEIRRLNQEGDEAKATELRETTFKSIQEESMAFTKEFIANNPKSFVAPYILNSISYGMEIEELESLVNGFDNSVSASPYLIRLKESIIVLKRVDIGQPFVDFTLNDTLDKPVSLSSLVGHGYLLIDFWAAWCGPCRAENPHVVKLYADFKDKGFEILGVSFDRTRDAWIKAIKDDGITWPQVSDLQYWNSAAGKLYGVRAIPHTVLIDPDGKIIAKNLRANELREKLTELLK